MSESNLDLSLVIPLFNEEESLGELVTWISTVMKGTNLTYEIIMVDDGSKDKSWQVLETLMQAHKELKGIKFRTNYGKSAALNVGFEAAQGQVVITMDADLQDSPEEIPELYKMIIEDGFDVVSGWKKKRHDPIGKRLPSKLFNAVIRRRSGIKLNDFNCGLKAYKKDVIKTIDVYGDLHRYLPVLAKSSGFDKIGEKVVEHRARKYGYSKFGISRLMTGFLDLVTLTFVSKFGKRPMHFFGTLGVFSFLIGFGILFYLSLCKLVFGVGGIATRPIFFFGILTLIIGTQLFVTGFLAELVIKNDTNKNQYVIEKKVRIEN